jgi:hypothetical protein
MVLRQRLRRRVFAIHAVTALLGLAAFPLAKLLGEPYPWLIMPGFEGNGGFDGQRVRMVEPAFTFHLEGSGPGSALADRRTRELSAAQVFADVNRSNVRRLSARFQAHHQAPPRLAHLVPTRLFPGFGSARRTPLDPHDPELFAWLVARLRAHEPRARVTAVRVAQRERVVDQAGRVQLRPLPIAPLWLGP